MSFDETDMNHHNSFSSTPAQISTRRNGSTEEEGHNHGQEELESGLLNSSNSFSQLNYSAECVNDARDMRCFDYEGMGEAPKVQLSLDMLPHVSLPDDFLRLPSSSSISSSSSSGYRYSITLQKDERVGLGMTIRDSCILRNVPQEKMRTTVLVTNLDFDDSPARLSGVKVGDVLEEINDNRVFSVRQAAEIIRDLPICQLKLSFFRSLHRRLGSEENSVSTNFSHHFKGNRRQHVSSAKAAHHDEYPGKRITNTNMMAEKQSYHPILTLLQSRNLIPSSLFSTEQMLHSSYIIRNWLRFESSLSYTRMPLCIRILHHFEDPEGHGIAYTIWVHDVSSGKEWFAPSRYYRDFVDLRSHSIRLCSKVQKYSLKGQSGLFHWQSSDESNQVERTVLLESFLRNVCMLLYISSSDDPGISDVALHLRSFLGCDEDVFTSSPTRAQRIGSSSKEYEIKNHRSVQLYVYLIFTLPSFQHLISSFIEDTRKRAESIFKKANAGRQTARWLKVVSTDELKRVGTCLNQLTDMILEGSKCDLFRSNIETERNNNDCLYPSPKLVNAVREQVEIEVYVPLRSLLSKELVNAYRNEDLETYYKIKKLKGRSQDFFEIKKRHQSPTDWCSVSNIIKEGVCRGTLPCLKLQAIVESAKEVTRLYTSEHHQIVEQPQDTSLSEPSALDNLSTKSFKHVMETDIIGADDFLPIFIFCVVRSEMERPCALMALLSGLCDTSKGEASYYLATFEAAIAHIRELDLESGSDQFR